MTSKELTAQGIAALKEGDKNLAQDLLQEAVDLDPNNAKAWYFLSKTQTSVAEKRTSLNTVLAILPDNQLAKDALAELANDGDTEIDFSEFEEEDSEPEPIREHPSTEPDYQSYQSAAPSAISSLPKMGLGSGIKPRVGQLESPIAIEDAPAVVEPQMLWQEFVTTFKNGVDILRRTPDVYRNEMQRATWWRFWSFMLIAFAIGSVVSAIAGFMLQSQIANTVNNSPFVTESIASPNIFSLLVSIVLFIPINVVMFYVAIYASYWFMTTRRNGQASLRTHSYTILVPVVTASLITDLATLVFSLVPLLVTLVAVALLVLWIYSMYIAAQGLTMAHGVDDSSGYWTMGVFALATFAVGLVLSPFLLSTGLV